MPEPSIHWTDTRITVEVPMGSLVGGAPAPTPTGLQPVVVRTATGEESAPVTIDIKILNSLSQVSSRLPLRRRRLHRPLLARRLLPHGRGRVHVRRRTYDRRDIKDVDFGDLDNDGDLDILDVSSPCRPADPGGTPATRPGFSPAGCGAPVNFPDRLFINDGSGRFTDITGGADGDYDTAADNPLPFFHSFRTYDADLADVNNDGYLDVVRADRALCAGDPRTTSRTSTPAATAFPTTSSGLSPWRCRPRTPTGTISPPVTSKVTATSTC